MDGITYPKNWLEELVNGTGKPFTGLADFLYIIFAVMGVMAIGYSVWLGFLLAKAPDENKRKEAKQRIMKTVVGLFIIIILTGALFSLSLAVNTRGNWSVEIDGMTKADNGWWEVPLSKCNTTTGTEIQLWYRRGTTEERNYTGEGNGGKGGSLRIVITDSSIVFGPGEGITDAGKVDDIANSTGRYFKTTKTGTVTIAVEYCDYLGNNDFKTGVSQFKFRVVDG
jgi:hypothetical protein